MFGGDKMGRFVNPCNDAFRDVLNSKIYVDKSGLIEYMNSVIDTVNKFICNSRPRRFGKSITADMLTAYYSRSCDSEEMFASLDIGKSDDYKKYLNKYDVIQIDMQWCIEPAGGVENVIAYVTQNIIEELKQYYPNEINEQIASLPEALSCINMSEGKKFIVIIDEWDVLIRDNSADDKIQEEYINFLRAMFKGSEPTKYIHLAYLTGILPIKKIQTQSALNNFDEFTMLDAGIFAKYIGFTEDEVKKLCKEYKRDFEKVKLWYDGYNIDGYDVYNPKAVVSCMMKEKFKSYWSQTGTYEAVVPLINMDFDGLRTAIIEMLSGNAAPVDISSFQNDAVNFTNKDDILTYLIHLGYLGYDEDKRTAFIPNEEIRQEFTNAAKRKKWNELIEFQKKSDELLNATLDMDEDAVDELIEQVHMEYASSIRYNDENFLSSVLTIGYLSAMRYYFKPVREFPTGRGFADFVFIPKTEYRHDYPALVVELKWNKTAKAAIAQIEERKYPESVRQYTGDILLVGINYDKKSKKHDCVIRQFNQ